MPRGMQKQQLRQVDWRENDNTNTTSGALEVTGGKGGKPALDASLAKGTTAQRVKVMNKQLMRFLRSHAGRVIDLFRAWDTSEQQHLPATASFCPLERHLAATALYA